MPNLSERHKNRAQLKKKLLKELWNEDQENFLQMNHLVIPDEVWRVMDERYILLEDIEKVILHSQETGERFYNPEDGSYLASLRIQDVTYWVRYIVKDGSAQQDAVIQVITVYSHRMEVGKE